MSKKFNSEEERRAYWRDWYHRNKLRPGFRAKEVKHTKEIRQQRREWWAEYRKQFKCSSCTENHPACLDFHHLDPSEKDDCITNMVRGARSVETIEKEIAKCICLCSNCHRKLHHDGRASKIQGMV
jgi:hypothetical protein